MSILDLDPCEGASPVQRAFITSRDYEVCLMSPRGEGKCLHPATPILLWPGERVLAASVRKGLQLVGPDWQPRKIISVTEGSGPLYEVRPLTGFGFEAFVCNGPHKLVLFGPKGQTIMTVKQWLEAPLELRRTLRLGKPDGDTVAFEVLEVGSGPWVGFTLEGDGQFLLGDGTITHNTEAGIRRMVVMSAAQPKETWPIPWAIVRDTWKNLERTTLRSFLVPHPGSFAEKIRPLLKVSDRGERLSIPGLFDCYLFGIDSLGDLNRFQSLQLAGLWLEEPAPAIQESGMGLDERVLTIGVTSLRYPCEWRTVQITANYPDESHWLWQRYAVRKIGRLFEIPRGENPHLPPNYRKEMEESLAGDPGLLDRLVYGRPAVVCQGVQVTPEYNPELHRANIRLRPIPGLPGYRFWDGGLNPACVVAQYLPYGSGQLQILEVFAGRRMGMYQLVTEFVKPAMQDRYACITQWEDIGDPSIAAFEQSNMSYSQTAAAIIERELHTYFQPGERLWAPRQEALRRALLRENFICLSGGPETEILHRALRGGWHYRKLPTGEVSGRIPVKDLYSHCGDALSYGVLEVLKLVEAPTEDDYERDFYILSTLPSRGKCPVTGY